MTRRRLFVIVPRFRNESPVQGVVALCNALAESRPVTLVTLKSSARGPTVHPAVDRLDLTGASGWHSKYRRYRSALTQCARRPISLSIGFSGDLFNAFFRQVADIWSSLRNNPYQDYSLSHGTAGRFAAAVHVRVLGTFHLVIAMSRFMESWLRSQGVLNTAIVGNFIDEERTLQRAGGRHTPNDDSPLRLVFVGSLISRKRVDLALHGLSRLLTRGVSAQLDVIGDGPLRAELQELCRTLGLQEAVRFRGYLQNPLEAVARSDLLLLPSVSEGVSRAALEALHLGVPVVLRRTEAAPELIDDGRTGVLFDDDAALPEALVRACELARMRRRVRRTCLIPDPFRQRQAIECFLKLLETADSIAESNREHSS